ncbi:MAG TPA: hypothetical protein VN883_18130 [Myxococcales bacterium]|jgi:hypothetical protein|nr:hypothetical protein [Myxococcales bacterium]
MLRTAAQLFAKRGGALVVVASIALLPAQVLKTALVAAGRYRMAAAPLDDIARVKRDPGERQGRLRDTMDSGDLDGAPTNEGRLDRAVEAISDLTESHGLRWKLIAAALFLATLPLVAAGVSLALGAVAPLVLQARHGERVCAEECWGIAGERIGPLFGTVALACALSVVGMFLCVLPGLVLMLGFAFAAPVVVLEGKSGVPALRRSLSLVAAVLPRILISAAAFALLRGGAALVAVYLLPYGALVERLLVTDVLSTLLFPLPIVGLALLYEEARAASAPAPAQYIRRSSAPG